MKYVPLAALMVVMGLALATCGGHEAYAAAACGPNAGTFDAFKAAVARGDVVPLATVDGPTAPVVGADAASLGVANPTGWVIVENPDHTMGALPYNADCVAHYGALFDPDANVGTPAGPAGEPSPPLPAPTAPVKPALHTDEDLGPV